MADDAEILRQKEAAAKAAEDARLAEEARAKEVAAKAAEDARRAEEARSRAAALDAQEAAVAPLHAQATGVLNIKALIPVTLDQSANNYSKWRGLFLVVLGKYALSSHVLNGEALLDRPA